ncbi:MAG: c-type cytochrome [Gammaproteobacteria bacterium]|nr:c-type cytochrome [Gammaproteobacteria bacterium]
MKNKIFTGLLITCGVVLGGAAAAATPSATMLSNTCVGCHGPNGNSMGPASPTIAGISTEYFMEAMEEYKSGVRPSTIMGRIAKGYSEEEFQLMASYFSKQQFNRDKDQNINAKMAKKGAKLHKKYCEKCHEDGGRSSEDDAGILAGQWMPYLQFTMTDYLSGNREMTKKMKKKVNTLKDEQGDKGFEELWHYYGSLK